MSSIDPVRRGFLRNLASLPLIGGGITLVGQPTAAAVAVTPEMLESYNTWLHMQRNLLIQEMGRGDYINPNNPGFWFHWRDFGTPDVPPASTRAAVVLSAIGCDWREG